MASASLSVKVDDAERRVRELLAEQRALVSSLLALRQQLQGSLFTRWGRCGKEGCACRTGRGHGPYYVLSTRSGGQGGFAYLERGQAAQARRLVGGYREFRKGLRRLRVLNRELMRRMGRYQQAATRQAQRRVGLA
jgi:hypothetical protein